MAGHAPSSVVALECTWSPGFKPSFSVVNSFVFTVSLVPHTALQREALYQNPIT